MITAYRNLGTDHEAIEAVLEEFDAYQRTSESEVLATGRGSRAFVYRTAYGSLGWPYARNDSRAKASGVSGPVYPIDVNWDERVAATESNMTTESYAAWLFWSGNARGQTTVVTKRKKRMDMANVATREGWRISYVGVRTVGVEAVVMPALLLAGGPDALLLAILTLNVPVAFWERASELVKNGRYRSTLSGRVIARLTERGLLGKPKPQIGSGAPTGLGGVS